MGWIAAATLGLVAAMLAPIELTAHKVSAATNAQPDGTCGLCILAPTGDALDLTGEAHLAAYGSNVMVDSSDRDGITLTGKATIAAPSVGVVGGATSSGKAMVQNLTTGAAAAQDPLAGSPIPALARPARPASVKVDGKEQRAIFPGVYDDISVGGHGALTLNPGTYVILHQFSASGNGSVVGRGISLYLACSDYPKPCTGHEGGELDLTGQGRVDLTAAQGVCSSLLVEADPRNTGEIQITGNSTDRLTGSIYAASGSLKVTGNGSFAIGGQVVVSRASITGRGTTSISGAAPQVAHPTLNLSPASAGPDHVGSQQALTASLRDGSGRPVANERVALKVGGANEASPSGLTDDAGQVRLTYSGLHGGTDSAQAMFGNGDVCVQSNTASVTWTTHPAPIAMGPVQGNFYAAPASAHSFAATASSTPLFAQQFPVVDFNPPAGTVPGNGSGVGPSTRPFTDVTTNLAGDYTGTTVAQGNGNQAGVGSASTFDAVLHSTFVVSTAGDVSFSVIADDGFLLGVGNGATAVTGPDHNAPSSGTTPFSGYPLMASWDDLGTGSPATYPVTVHFPAAGTYPYELDYLSRSSQLALVLAVAAGGAQPPPLAVYTGYADTARPPGANAFPYPWQGTPGVNFVGSPDASSENWQQLSPRTSPPARFAASMAYDGATRDVVVFGGNASQDPAGNLGDTWTWDGSTWTQQTPGSSPAARGYAMSAFDPHTSQLILFGGTDTGDHVLGDTWSWTGTNWIQLHPAHSPPAREAGGLAYDPQGRDLVLFGGSSTGSSGDPAASSVGDTWTWDGNDWTQQHPAASPSARVNAFMALDDATGRIVLFGGGDASHAILSDTWTWSGTNWSQAATTGRLAAGSTGGSAFDPAIGRLVEFGGQTASTFAGGGSSADTWTWDGTAWTQEHPAGSPSSRDDVGMAYDSATGQLLLFGGDASTPVGDTWVYTSTPTWDTGALRFDNTTGAAITLDHVTVDIGSRHYDPGFTNVMVPANGTLVLAGSGGSFDTSDAGGGTATSTSPSTFTASQFATDFPTSTCGATCGPIGVAFDQAGNLYVGDIASGNLYRFGASGGTASTHLVGSVTDQPGSLTGLAFSKSGRLYGVLSIPDQLVEISPTTGAVLRVVATLASGYANGLAIDPVSGDAFVSNADAVRRITGIEGSGPASVSTYAGMTTDGLVFGPDGTLYAAASSGIVALAGTNQPQPASISAIASVPSADGMALFEPDSAHPKVRLAVNRNDGTVTEIDTNTTPPTLTDMVTGGSRGDFATTGPDGCLYATQSSSVEKVTASDGSCPFVPPACSVSTAVPQIHVTIGGVITTYADSNRVLTIGGRDAECGGGGGGGSAPTGFSVAPYATGLPNNGSQGPIGVAMDSARNLYVGDDQNGNVYKFPPGGGTAAGHQLPGSPGVTSFGFSGMVITPSGRLYDVKGSDLVELSPDTGMILRTVITTPNGCPAGIARDPLSGDLFVSSWCGGPVSRISGYEGAGPPAVTQYASGAFDGIAFGPDGTLYAASQGYGVVAISGTDKPQPATITALAGVGGGPDGIAVVAPPSGQPVTRLLVNRNDGVMSEIDLSTSPPTVTDAITGGTRGDLATTGPDGCFYATQTSSVVKVTASDGSCPFVPSGNTISESHQWLQLNPGAPTINVPMPPALTLAISPSAVPGSTVGKALSVTVTALDSSGQAVSGLPVTLGIVGANPQPLTSTTDAGGATEFSYTGLSAGTDTITASAFQTGALEVSNSVPVTWTIPLPAPSGNTVGQSAPAIFSLSPVDQTVVSSATPISATILAPSGFSLSNWSVTSQLLPSGSLTTLASGSGAPPATLATFDPAGLAAGTYAVTVSASSTGGGTASAVTRLVIAGAGTGGGAGGSSIQAPPTITQPSPPDGSVVTGPVPVQATLTPPAGETIASWRVTYQAMDPEAPVTLASGTGTPPTPLATFDPTLLPNDTYAITISATSSGGGTQSETTTVSVSGNLKLGRYVTTSQDLSIPVNGFQMQVVRTYDSTDKRVGDFGVGWHVSVSNFRTSPNRQLGAGGWSEYTTGCFILCSWAWRTATPHYVTVTWPDGHQEVFDFTPSGPQMTLVDFNQGTAAFTARPGTNTTSTLAVASPADQQFLASGDGDLRGADGTVYNPTRFVLTTSDGRVLVLDTAVGLVSEMDPSGNSLKIDALGVHSYAGPASSPQEGPSITFLRDSQNRISEMTDPSGARYEYTYSGVGDLTSLSDPAGTTTYSYDANHDLVATGGTGHPASTLGYDTSGRLTSITDATGHTTHISDALSSQQQVIVDPTGSLSTVDSFDSFGDLLQRQRSGGGQTLTEGFAYDGAGRLLIHTDAGGATSTYTYDSQGNVVTAVDPVGDVDRFTYDTDGHQLTVARPDGRLSAQLTYSGTGLLTSVTQADGSTYSFKYNAAGDRTSVQTPKGAVTSVGYDAAGRMTDVSDPMGYVTRYSYDSDGRVLSVTDPGGNTSHMTYDGVGDLTTVTDAAGGVWRYTYDAGERLLGATDPLGHTSTRTYDALGNLGTLTDRNGATITYGYDADGRPVSQVASDGAATKFTYDPFGRLTSAANTTELDQFTYDNIGDVLTATSSGMGQPTVVVQHGYDSLGREISRSTSAGTTTYGYDADSRLARVVDPGGGQFSYGYTPLSQVEALSRPNGTTDSYAFDTDGNLLSRVTTHGGIEVAASRYTYDADGRRTSATVGSTKTVYAYAPTGWLLDAASGAGEEAFTYDSRGNRLGNGAVYNAADELVSDNQAHYTYDSEGDRTSRIASSSTTQYTWNAFHELVAVSLPDGATEAFRYDPLGRRVEANPGGITTRYAYSGADPVLFYSGSNSLVQTSVNASTGNDGSLELRSGTTAQFPLQDGANSTIGVTDSGGSAGSGFSYSVFGVPRQPTAASIPFTYTGREYDPSAGLYYERLRYLDPATGTFLSQDPIHHSNPYQYAQNDPIDLVDPFGAQPMAEDATLESQDSAEASSEEEVGACVEAAAAEEADAVATAEEASAEVPEAATTATRLRFDTRPPDEIFGKGFTPRGTSTDLQDYTLNNSPSIYVGTSSSLSGAQSIADWQGGTGWIYGISQPGGIDINAVMGPDYVHSFENEIAYPGGIQDEYVIGATRVENGQFTGETFYNPGYSGCE